MVGHVTDQIILSGDHPQLGDIVGRGIDHRRESGVAFRAEDKEKVLQLGVLLFKTTKGDVVGNQVENQGRTERPVLRDGRQLEAVGDPFAPSRSTEALRHQKCRRSDRATMANV